MMIHHIRSLKAVWLLLAAVIVLSLPCVSPAVRAEEPAVITVPGITVTVKDGGNKGDPAAGYIMRQMTGGGAPTKGAAGFSKLEGNDARLYTALKPLIAEVAAGQRGSTEFEIPVEDIFEKYRYTAGELGFTEINSSNASTVKDAMVAKASIDLHRVMSALLVDCPYELYWFDKTMGIGSGYSYSYYPGDSTAEIWYADDYTFIFYVSAEYSVSGTEGTFAVDTSWGTSVQAAAAAARGIVSDHAGLGDIEKLTAYKDEICGLVDYNHAAADDDDHPYGNPWQLVWVFDGDDSTKVVCEGYSKAFQFLCDESSFSGNIGSIIVSGTMQGGTGAGGHMWNVVTLDNGRKYLADVTNSDAGSVGQLGGLFLDSFTTKEALSDGRVKYTYEIGSQPISYWYADDIIDLYGPDDLSLPMIIDQGTLDGGIAWALDDNGLLTLEGSGEAAVASADAQPWYGHRSGITSAHVSEGITSLGDHLFHGLNALESVDLPSGLESIGAYTFDNCAALQAVDLPAGLTSIGDHAFDGCHALASVVIPDTVTSMGISVFSNCHALSSAVVGSGVTELPEGAFNNCESLADVTFRGPLTSIGPWAFSNGDSNGGQIWAMSSFTVPDTVTSIGAYAFNLQTGLTEMTLPASVEEIGAYAFKSCRGLTSVTVLDRDAVFGVNVFENCGSVTLRGYACSTAADYAKENNISYEVIPGGDHTWGEAEYTWADDNTSVTAAAVCGRCSHEETETVETTSVITKEPGCVTMGETTYTAVFTSPAFETQIRTEEDVPATGHAWGTPEYTWAEDMSTVTAVRVCANDESHRETETAPALGETTLEPTCEEKGETTYTASFGSEVFTDQTRTVADIDALGHDWGEPEYTWAENLSVVTATRVCNHDPDHEETETVYTVSEITKPAGCETMGETTYTAVFTSPAFETQIRTEEDVPATGHAWGTPEYTWAEDLSAVTAVRVCVNDESHIG